MKLDVEVGTLVVLKNKYRTPEKHSSPLSTVDIGRYPDMADRIYRVVERNGNLKHPECLFVEDALDNTRDIFPEYRQVFIDPVFLKKAKSTPVSDYEIGTIVTIKPKYHGLRSTFPGGRKKDKYVLDLESIPSLSKCEFEIVGIKKHHYQVRRTDGQTIWAGHKICHFHKDAVTV